MSDFFQTKMGQIFYNKQLPQLINNLQNIGKSLETIAGNVNRPDAQDKDNRLIVETVGSLSEEAIVQYIARQ